MTRRNHQQPDQLQQLLIRVQKTFTDSPLAPIGAKLETLLTESQEAILAGNAKPEQATQVANSVRGIRDMLPQTFGERFYFDASMIKALADHWRQGAVQLSEMIVPRTSQTWGHRRVAMPSENRDNAHVVDLILFPGEDDLGDMDLLEYPLLCHELGHNVFFRCDTTFVRSFKIELDRVSNILRLRAMADRGSAEGKAQKMIEEICRFWRPTLDHHNWAHELAIDMIALWTCGPAYLAAFQNELHDPDINPYQIDQSHPPYEVRASALVSASRQLGWSTHTGDLTRLIQGWRKSEWKSQRTNRYVALIDPELVKACVSAALETSKALALPKCTLEQVSNVRDTLRREDIPDFGVDLLLAAWLVEREQGEQAFEQWEQKAIRVLSSSITR